MIIDDVPRGYTVNNKLFFNRHLAHIEQMTNGGLLEFNMFDDAFSKYNWKIDPTLSFEELIDIRAHQIRETNDVVVLWFSGGTDSLTMYNAFIRNNLHIDEIIVRYWPIAGHFGIDKSIIDWLYEHHPDKKTTITTIDQTDKTVLSSNLYTDEWTLLNMGFAKHLNAAVVWGTDALSKKYENRKWVQVHGFEKPHLVYRNEKFSAWHLDLPYQSTLGHENMEYFFISPELPELHIKQCHLLKNHLVDNLSHTLHEDFRSEKLFETTDQSSYMNLSVHGCGRHGEIHHKICVSEKSLIRSKKVIFSKTENYNDLKFTGYQSILHASANNIDNMKHWYNGRLELIKSPVMKYMLDRNLVTNKDDPFSFVGMYSKQYDLE